MLEHVLRVERRIMVNQITENGKELLLKGKYFVLILIPAKDYSVLNHCVLTEE